MFPVPGIKIVKKRIPQRICIINHPPEITKVALGSRVVLPVLAYCPNQDTQWYDRNGECLHPKEQTTVRYSHKLVTMSKLIISNVAEEDFGFYRVKITNRAAGKTEYSNWVEIRRQS